LLDRQTKYHWLWHPKNYDSWLGWSLSGCVAKTFEGQSNPYNQLSLCSNSENLIHELYLT
jgi:hypothetical protein